MTRKTIVTNNILIVTNFIFITILLSLKLIFLVVILEPKRHHLVEGIGELRHECRLALVPGMHPDLVISRESIQEACNLTRCPPRRHYWVVGMSPSSKLCSNL